MCCLSEQLVWCCDTFFIGRSYLIKFPITLRNQFCCKLNRKKTVKNASVSKQGKGVSDSFIAGSKPCRTKLFCAKHFSLSTAEYLGAKKIFRII